MRSRTFFDSAILLLAAGFVFRGALFNAGYPLGADGIAWIGYPAYMAHHSWWLATWESIGFPGTVGQIVPFYLPLTFLFYIFGSPIGVKLLLFSVYLGAGLSMYALSLHWFRNRNIALVSGLLYMVSRTLLDQLIQGQLWVVLGYSFLPVLPLAWGLMVRKRTFKHTLLAAMAFSVYLGNAHLSFVYVSLLFLGPLLFLDTLSAKRESRVSWLRFIQPMTPFPFVFVALSLIFALPVLAGRSVAEQVTDRPLYLLLNTMLRLSAKDILEGLTLYGIEAKTYFPSIAGGAFLIALPILSFPACFFRKEGKVFLLTLLALIFVFMAKGPNAPLGDLFLWPVDYVPYFSGLRSPPRGLLVVSFSYALLAGITVESTRRWIQDSAWLKQRNVFKLPAADAASATIACLLVAISLVPQWPAIRFGLKSFVVPEDFRGLYQWLEKQPGDFVVANLPFQGGPGWIDPLDPAAEPGWSSTSEYGMWSSAFHGKTVLAYSQWYPYARFYLQTNNNLVRNTGVLGKLLGAFNVKYVAALPYAAERERTQVLTQEGLTVAYENGDGAVYENAYWTPRLFAAPRYLFVVGGPQALLSSASLLQSPEKRLVPLVFLFGNTLKLEELLAGADTLVFADGDYWDLLFASLQARGSQVLDAVSYVATGSASQRDWRAEDMLTSAGFSIASSSWSYAASGRDGAVMDIPVLTDTDGVHEVWLRAYHGFPGQELGMLSVELDDQRFEDFQLKFTRPFSTFRWVKVGEVELQQGNHLLRLTNREVINEGSANYIDQVAVVPSSTIATGKEHLSRLLQGKRVVHLVQENRISTSWKTRNVQESSDGVVLATDSQGTATFDVSSPLDGAFFPSVRSVGSPEGGQVSFVANGTGPSVGVDAGDQGDLSGPTVLTDDGQAAFWSPINAPEQVAVSDDPSVKRSGADSLRLDVKAGRSAFTLLQKDFDQEQDWSRKRFLSLWFKGTGSNVPLLLTVYSNRDDTQRATLSFPDTGPEWSLTTIPLPTATTADWAHVSGLRLAWDTKDVAGTLYFDSIVLWDGRGSPESAGPTPDSTDGVWVFFDEPLQLSRGDNTVSLKTDADLELDVVALASRPGDLGEIFTYAPDEDAPAVSYEQRSPTHYQVSVFAAKPFLLHFSETYHRGWRAYVDGEEMPPVPVNYYFNGFAIDKTGEYNIDIVFTPQKYASFGAKASGISWLLAVVYLAVVAVGRRGQKKG